jgi:hypothetical protein
MEKEEANGESTMEGINETYCVRVIPKDSRLPVPRRDHSATLIKDSKYLLIFGGRNDNSQEMQMVNGLNAADFTALNDLLLYDIKARVWTCIGQLGFKPSPRWNAALCVSDSREQIYIFGGSNHQDGACSNEVYCLDFNSSAVQTHLATIRQANDEAILLSKKFA